MTPGKAAVTARAIVDDVLGRAMARDIWTGNYDKVLPLSVQQFELTAVLPAVFYMFRFAQRRGRASSLRRLAEEPVVQRKKKSSRRLTASQASLLRAHTSRISAAKRNKPSLVICSCRFAWRTRTKPLEEKNRCSESPRRTTWRVGSICRSRWYIFDMFQR